MLQHKKDPHVETVRATGLCATCSHFPDCAYLRNSEKPVVFCEDFECALPTSRTGIVKPDLVPFVPHSKTDIEKKGHFKEYIGLCKTCKKLPMCTFTKPGGGTWRCEYYEKETGD
jgi:hypothetical protein